jgi:DnaJ-class molecular chaperone
MSMSRTNGSRAHPGTTSVAYVLGEEIDVEVEHQLPGKYEICSACSGHGASSAYLGAITSEERERDWDPEEFEDYMEGAYDKTCEECKGSGKVVEVDEESCNKELLERYYKAEQEKAQDAYNDRYTMWMESGGREPMY